MSTRNLFKATLLFSGCFIAFSLVLVHEFVARSISPRGLAACLAALFVAGLVTVALWSKAASNARPQDVEPARGLTVGLGRIAVAVLVLAFLNGLWHIREKPLAPRLVGLGANLLITYSIIFALRKTQKNPNPPQDAPHP